MVIKTFLIIIVYSFSFSIHAENIDTLYPMRGISNLKLGETKFSEAKRKYSKFESSKFFQKHEVLPVLKGNYIKELRSDDLGITMYFKKKRCFGNYYLTKIRLDSSYIGKADSGLGIGTNMKDVVLFFQNKNEISTTDDTSLNCLKSLFYHFYVNTNEEIRMSFFAKSVNDSCYVNLIILDYNYYR